MMHGCRTLGACFHCCRLAGFRRADQRRYGERFLGISESVLPFLGIAEQTPVRTGNLVEILGNGVIFEMVHIPGSAILVFA